MGYGLTAGNIYRVKLLSIPFMGYIRTLRKQLIQTKDPLSIPFMGYYELRIG